MEIRLRAGRRARDARATLALAALEIGAGVCAAQAAAYAGKVLASSRGGAWAAVSVDDIADRLAAPGGDPLAVLINEEDAAAHEHNLLDMLIRAGFTREEAEKIHCQDTMHGLAAALEISKSTLYRRMGKRRESSQQMDLFSTLPAPADNENEEVLV